METKVIIEVLAASVRIATPLLFAALGGLLSESAGTFAVGIEGMMLMGAFGGAIASLICHSAVAGLLASAISGATIGTIVAVATARFRADQMVTGLAVNIFAFGLSSFLLRRLFGGNAPAIVSPTLGAVPLPFLSRLPIIGPVLFAQPALTYAAFLLAFALQLFLTKTRFGLALRAVGENPAAAFSTGTEPDRVRMAATIAASTSIMTLVSIAQFQTLRSLEPIPMAQRT